MSAASEVRVRELEKEIHKPSKSPSSPMKESRDRSVFRPHKPFKQMTSVEYRRYLQQAGMEEDLPERCLTK